MLKIEKVDHIGIRVREKARSMAFYSLFGFEAVSDHGFEQGAPVIMEHPSGIVLNLLGPATSDPGPNILMDVDQKYPGYTHMALKVSSLDELRSFLEQKEIKVTGGFQYKGVSALFIRDPDGSVIEFDEYVGDNPETRRSDTSYAGHQ